MTMKNRKRNPVELSQKKISLKERKMKINNNWRPISLLLLINSAIECNRSQRVPLDEFSCPARPAKSLFWARVARLNQSARN